MQHCYDFPEVVLHANDGTCPRYNGGICHPMPTPNPPTTEEERIAVDAYNDFKANGIKVAKLIRPTGATIYPEKEGRA
jgi:hypothetical protein